MKNIATLFLLLLLFNLSLSAQDQVKIDSLGKILKTDISDKERIDIWNQIARFYIYSDLSQTPFYTSKAIELSKEIGYLEGISDAYYLIGWKNMLEGNYSKAIEAYNQARLNANKSSHEIGEANAYNGLGVIYYHQGNYPQALEFFLKSLKIKEKFGDLNQMAASYNNIGAVYYYQSNNAQALEYYLKALKLREEKGDKNGMADGYNNIGEIQYEQGNYQKALEFYQTALKLREEIGDKKGIALTYNNIGDIYLSQKEYSKAITYNQKSLALYQELGAEVGQADPIISLGKIYRETKRYDKALEYLKKGLWLSQEKGAKQNIREVAEVLSQTYSEMGDYKSAYQSHLLFKQMADSLNNEENTKKLTTQSLQYEFDKKQAQAEVAQEKKELLHAQEIKNKNYLLYGVGLALLAMLLVVLLVYKSYKHKQKANALLAKKNQEIESQSDELKSVNDKLTKLNQTKDKFFSIIGHDLKGPMNSLSSFTYLLKEHIGSMSKEEIHNLATDLNESLKGVNHLLENLLNWARSQSKQIDFQTEVFDLSELLEGNKNLLNETAKIKGLIIDNQSNTPLHVNAHKHSINMVIRNLLSNAIKFTPEAGQITLSCTAADNEVWVSVKDTGVGMTQETIDNMLYTENINSSQGTANEKGTGLGISLCKEFVERNGGLLRIQSEVEKGSEFSFSLPLTKEFIDTDGVLS